MLFSPVLQNNGTYTNPTNKNSELNDIFKKLTQPVVQNASALGSDKANITIVEFSDYKCQYCARFHRETKSQLIDNFVNTGQVKFMFKDFVVNDRPMDKQSTLSRQSFVMCSRSRDIGNTMMRYMTTQKVKM